MTHWFFIIPSTTARMSIRPKRLKWVKTVHEGGVNDLELGLVE
jgi:1,2-diacylglycerol 3-beta-glucosyltransferase